MAPEWRRTRRRRASCIRRQPTREMRRRCDCSGVMYENGAGVAKDAKKAGELYQAAADKGDAEALRLLRRDVRVWRRSGEGREEGGRVVSGGSRQGRCGGVAIAPA